MSVVGRYCRAGEVPDLYYGDEADFEHSWALMDAAAQATVQRLAVAAESGIIDPMNAQSVMELPGPVLVQRGAVHVAGPCRAPTRLAFVNGASVWCMQRLAEVAQQARNPGRLQLLVVQVPRFDFEREPQPQCWNCCAGTAYLPILLDAQ